MATKKHSRAPAGRTGKPAAPLVDVAAHRITLAGRALDQVSALLPLAQRVVRDVPDTEVDALLGLLGRMREMTDTARGLLGDAFSALNGDEPIELTNEWNRILGEREVAHG